MPAGNAARSSRMRAFTASLTSSAFAPVCRNTATPTAGWPSTVVLMS